MSTNEIKFIFVLSLVNLRETAGGGEVPFRELSGGEAAERRRSGKPKASRQTEGRGQRLVVRGQWSEGSGQRGSG